MMSIPQTPYRALSRTVDTPTIPLWASKRSVYRAGHETYYVAETPSITAARDDIATLEELGWIVTVQPLSLDGAARITMRLAEEACVA